MERFSPFDAIRIGEMLDASQIMHTEGTSYLADGDLDRFFPSYWGWLVNYCKGQELRDRHMGQNLSAAEARIRERYPQIVNKEPLIYVAHLGASHNPENFTTAQVNVCDLVDRTKMAIYADLEKGYKAGKTLHELRHEILAYGVYEATHSFGWGLTREVIQSMGFDELCQVVRTKASRSSSQSPGLVHSKGHQTKNH